MASLRTYVAVFLALLKFKAFLHILYIFTICCIFGKYILSCIWESISFSILEILLFRIPIQASLSVSKFCTFFIFYRFLRNNLLRHHFCNFWTASSLCYRLLIWALSRSLISTIFCCICMFLNIEILFCIFNFSFSISYCYLSIF